MAHESIPDQLFGGPGEKLMLLASVMYLSMPKWLISVLTNGDLFLKVLGGVVVIVYYLLKIVLLIRKVKSNKDHADVD